MREFFLQSYNLQPFHSGPEDILHLSLLSPKNNESYCIDKKTDHTKLVSLKCTQQVRVTH